LDRHHFDTLKEDDFQIIKTALVKTIDELTKNMTDRNLCPVCFCHMISVLASEAAKEHADKELRHVH
jgi:bacterioferritin-associated ferredoxin